MQVVFIIFNIPLTRTHKRIYSGCQLFKSGLSDKISSSGMLLYTPAVLNIVFTIKYSSFNAYNCFTQL